MDANQISQLLMQGGQQKATQGQLDRRAQLAQMLLQSGQQPSSPIVAALTGFIGTHELQNVARQQGNVDRAQMEREAAKEVYGINVQERQLGMQEQQMQEQQRQFNERMRQDAEQFQQTMQMKARELNESLMIKMQEAASKLTTGEEAVDKAFAKELVEFTAGGGWADTEKSIEQLNSVKRDFEKGKVATGRERKLIPDFLDTAIFPDSVAAQERVMEIVQRNLRLVLGAQFTQKEGEMLMMRAFNPQLPEKENIRRLEALTKSIESAARSKKDAAEYFAKNGTLKGWSGKMVNIGDIERAVDGDGWSIKVK